MGHPIPNIRKALVFCMVDLHFLLSKSEFEKFMNKLNANQR